jgi:hypothetical protein
MKLELNLLIPEEPEYQISLKDFKKIMVEEYHKDENSKSSENFLVLHVKNRIYALSAFFEVPLISSLKYRFTELKRTNLYFVDDK